MAYYSIWDNPESPYSSFSRQNPSAGLDDLTNEEIVGDPNQLQNGVGQALPIHDCFSLSHFPLGIDDLTSTAHHASYSHTQGRSRQNPELQHAHTAVTSVSPSTFPAEGPPDVSGASDLQPRVELVCLHCSNKTFGRKAEKDRHDREQHQCPHPCCKGRWFSIEARKMHMRSHKNTNVHFKCGSCDLVGKYKSIFKRCEKLKNHFAAVHNVRTVHTRYQCFDPACYDDGLIGGIYFVSREDHQKHVLLEHNLNGPDVNVLSSSGSTRKITESQGNDEKPSSDHPTQSNLQRNVEGLTGPEQSPRGGSISRTRQPLPLGIELDESTGLALGKPEGDSSVGRVLDCNNNTIGILIDWNECGLVFIPMPGNTLSQHKQILPVRRRPMKAAPGHEVSLSRSFSNHGWTAQSRNQTQTADPAGVATKRLSARKCPRTISAAPGCPRANKDEESALSRDLSRTPTSAPRSDLLNGAYACPMKRPLDVHQAEPPSTPTWTPHAAFPLPSPRAVGHQSGERPYSLSRGSSAYSSHDGGKLTPVTSAPF